MKKAELHRSVFEKKQNKKLLCVDVEAKAALPHTFFEVLKEPKKAIENAEVAYEKTKMVESDKILFVESNFLEVLVPSIFGAKIHEAPGGFIDVRPIFNDIYETEDVNITDIFSGEMENAIKHLTYLKENAPEYFYLSPTRQLSPLDCAIVLCGGEFYTELYAEPELATAFMEKICDVTIKVSKEFKKLINQPIDECITPRGYLFGGIRLTGDSVVNLSPNMIQKIMCPLYKRFEEEFSSVMLHYCCMPAPSAHVAPALAEGGGITWVDNWQGYKTILKEEDYLRTDIGICTDIDKNLILSGDILKDEFFTIDRPLVSSTRCATVEEGKAVYEKWQEYFG